MVWPACSNHVERTGRERTGAYRYSQYGTVRSVDNNQDFQRMEMGGHYWKILDGKLNFLDCKESKTQLNIQYKDEKGKENIRLNNDNQGITVKRK